MELVAGVSLLRQGRLMAAVTQVYTIDYVAKLLGEDPGMLEAIVSNDDNLSYGAIVSVHTGTDEVETSDNRGFYGCGRLCGR